MERPIRNPPSIGSRELGGGLRRWSGVRLFDRPVACLRAWGEPRSSAASAGRSSPLLPLCIPSPYFVLLLFIGIGCGDLASAETVRGYFLNREGVRKFADKAYYPAYQSFLKALEDDPLNPELHLNLARTFEVNEEFEKAERAYKSALKII